MNDTTLSTHAVKKRTPRKNPTFVRQNARQFLWMALLIFGMIQCGGIAVVSFALAGIYRRADAIVMGLLCAGFVLVLLREFYLLLRQIRRKRRAAVGFRLEHGRIEKLLLGSRVRSGTFIPLPFDDDL